MLYAGPEELRCGEPRKGYEMQQKTAEFDTIKRMRNRTMPQTA